MVTVVKSCVQPITVSVSEQPLGTIMVDAENVICRK